MTQPISNERVEWLKQRGIIVDECIRIAQTEMHQLSLGATSFREDLFIALKDFSAERMSINIELMALKKYEVTP